MVSKNLLLQNMKDSVHQNIIILKKKKKRTFACFFLCACCGPDLKILFEESVFSNSQFLSISEQKRRQGCLEFKILKRIEKNIS